jgi:NAD(P)-dependent dehydrogenase (short-subunit alcohol dehydrogenase family)
MCKRAPRRRAALLEDVDFHATAARERPGEDAMQSVPDSQASARQPAPATQTSAKQSASDQARFAGKVAIVTGGAGGIGFATAHAFAAAGAAVTLVGHDAARTAAAVQRLCADRAYPVRGATCDVADAAAVRACTQETLGEFGRLDVIVNNAGVMAFKPIVELTRGDWLRTFDVDLFGAFYFIREAFLHMQPGGAIVNVSSVHAFETERDVAPYAAAKAALLSLTRSAAIEGKPLGIRVNAVVPGAVDTPMLWSNPNVQSGVEKIARADVGLPADVAAAILFLASDDARFVEGAALLVDGGRLARL